MAPGPIEPKSFIMSAVMFFVLSAGLLLIPNPTVIFATTRWGSVGPRECAAAGFVLGLLSIVVWLLTKNRTKLKR